MLDINPQANNLISSLLEARRGVNPFSREGSYFVAPNNRIFSVSSRGDGPPESMQRMFTDKQQLTFDIFMGRVGDLSDLEKYDLGIREPSVDDEDDGLDQIRAAFSDIGSEVKKWDNFLFSLLEVGWFKIDYSDYTDLKRGDGSTGRKSAFVHLHNLRNQAKRLAKLFMFTGLGVISIRDYRGPNAIKQSRTTHYDGEEFFMKFG